MKKFEIFNTFALKWQTKYGKDSIMKEVLKVIKWNKEIPFKIEDEFIILDKVPKRLAKLKVYATTY